MQLGFESRIADSQTKERKACFRLCHQHCQPVDNHVPRWTSGEERKRTFELWMAIPHLLQWPILSSRRIVPPPGHAPCRLTAHKVGRDGVNSASTELS
jgi:hypothetical protein